MSDGLIEKYRDMIRHPNKYRTDEIEWTRKDIGDSQAEWQEERLTPLRKSALDKKLGRY